jgi:hypothetical protein
LDKKNPIQSHNSFSKNPKIEKESVFLYWKMILKIFPIYYYYYWEFSFMKFLNNFLKKKAGKQIRLALVA